MSAQTLRVKETLYPIDKIQKGIFSKAHSLNEIRALEFCYTWLNGQEKFTLQTSGSTGTPKKISVTREQLKASAALSISALGLKKEFTALVCLDTRYIAGLMMLVRALEAGMNLHIVEPEANPFGTLSEEIPIDFTALVPYQVQTILSSKHKEKFSKTKIVLIGGASLSNSLRENLTGMPGAFYATYGMTETLSHIALQRLNGSNQTNYFHLLPGIKVQIDPRGCLVIRAPHLGAEPIVTNDLVEIVDANRFLLLGRIDDLINSGGVKIFPEKIESVIEGIFSDLKLNVRFFISGVPDLQFGEKVILCIEGIPLQETMAEKLWQILNDTLSRFEIPKEIRYVATFIKTDTGKINKPKTLASVP